MVVRVISRGTYGGARPYVPTPLISGRGGGGGGAPSVPSPSGTVYVYKGKEYSSEAAVKSAIASDILASEKVQEILKKQGGGSETVYVYKGSTYESPSEVQEVIKKETVESPKVREIMVGQEKKQSVGYTQPSFGVSEVQPSAVYSFDVAVEKPSVQPRMLKAWTAGEEDLSFGEKIYRKQRMAIQSYQRAEPTSKEYYKGKAVSFGTSALLGLYGGVQAIRHPVQSAKAMVSKETYAEIGRRASTEPEALTGELAGTYLFFKGLTKAAKPVATGIRYAALEKPLRETSLSRDLMREPFIRKRASVIIKEEGTGKILFTKERAGFARLPGGAIERGERSIVAAKRELFEETGLKGLKLRKTDIVSTATEKQIVFTAEVPKISELKIKPQRSELTGFFVAKVREGYQPTLTKPLGQKPSFFKPVIRSDDLFVASRSFAVEKVSKQIRSLSPVEKGALKVKAESWATKTFGIEKIKGIPEKSLITDYLLGKRGALYKPIRIPSRKAGSILVGLESRYKIPFSRQKEYAAKRGIFIHGAPTAELTESPVLGVPKDVFRKGIPIRARERGGKGLYFQPPSVPEGEAYLGASYLGLEGKGGYGFDITFRKPKPTAYFMEARYGKELFPTEKAVRGVEFEVTRRPGTKIVSKMGRERFYLGGKGVGVQEVKPFGLEKGKIPKGFKELPEYTEARYVSPIELGFKTGLVLSPKSYPFKVSKSKISPAGYYRGLTGYDPSEIAYKPSKTKYVPKYERIGYEVPPYKPPKYPPSKPPYYPPYSPPSYPPFYEPPYYPPLSPPFVPPKTPPAFGLPFGKGIFPREKPLVKGRSYRYTPSLAGISFGRPLRKAPRGSKVWSGFELRPLVVSKFRSLF